MRKGEQQSEAESAVHPPKGQTIGSNHFYRKRNRAKLRMSLSTYSNPSRSSPILARDGSRNSPAY